MLLTGSVVNALAIVIGTTLGLVIGSRMPERIQQTLTNGLGLFTIVLGLALSLRFMLEPGRPLADDLAVLGGLLGGAVIGEVLRLSDRLDAVGGWFQRRLARGGRPSTVSEAFVTASLVFCVGPLTILGSIQNGLTGDIQLLTVKSLLDGIAAIAFAAALGAGVYLAALTVLVVQGSIAVSAWLLGTNVDPRLVAAASTVGGVLLVGVGLRLLELRDVRIVNFLPGLLLAPLLVALVELA